MKVTGINSQLCNTPMIVMILLQIVQVGSLTVNWSPICTEEHYALHGRNEYGEWVTRSDSEYFFPTWNGEMVLMQDLLVGGELYPHLQKICNAVVSDCRYAITDISGNNQDF